MCIRDRSIECADKAEGKSQPRTMDRLSIPLARIWNHLSSNKFTQVSPDFKASIWEVLHHCIATQMFIIDSSHSGWLLICFSLFTFAFIAFQHSCFLSMCALRKCTCTVFTLPCMYHVPHHTRDFTYTTADLVSVLHLEHRTTVSMVESGRASGGLSSCIMVLISLQGILE